MVMALAVMAAWSGAVRFRAPCIAQAAHRRGASGRAVRAGTCSMVHPLAMAPAHMLQHALRIAITAACLQEVASAMQRSFSSAATGRTHTRSVPTAVDVAPEALPDPASRRHSRSRSRADTASSHQSPQRSVGAAAAAFAADFHFPDTPLGPRNATDCTLDSSTGMSPISDARGEATASLDDRTLKLMQMQQALDNASLFREMEVENHMLFNFTYVRGGTSGSGMEPGPASGGSSGMERRSDRSAAALRTGALRSPRGLPKPAPAAGASGSSLQGGGLSGGTGHLSYGPIGPSFASTRGGRSAEGPSGEAGTPSSLTASILPGPPQCAHALHGGRVADASPATADGEGMAGGPMWRVTPEGLVRGNGSIVLEDRLPGIPPRARPASALGDHLAQSRARTDSERSRRYGHGFQDKSMNNLLGGDCLFYGIGSGIGAPLSAISGKASVPPLSSNADMWVTAAESFGPGDLSGSASGSGTLREGSVSLQLTK